MTDADSKLITWLGVFLGTAVEMGIPEDRLRWALKESINPRKWSTIMAVINKGDKHDAAKGK